MTFTSLFYKTETLKPLPENRDIHQTIPDHRVQLTPDGWSQARAAGLKLRSLLRPSDTLHFFTSPYRRTRETTEGILDSLTSSYPSPSPFPRHTIKVYEEPRLREQDFGNFQPGSAEMSRMWQERADYGHFFYRIPNGESAADAYDRISGFNESLWRQFGEEEFASVCVLVTHGLMARVFLMKWYHFSVEYFEDLRNVNHCEFVVMKLDPGSGKYELKNQLRTWSELRRDKERGERQAEEGKLAATSPQSPVPVRKTWGRKIEGAERLRSYGPRRQNTADLFADEMYDQATNPAFQEENTPPPPTSSKTSPRRKRLSPAEPDILETGRDGGGSRSEEEEVDRTVRAGSMALALNGALPHRARADTLGDQSDVDDDSEAVQEIRRRESAERSFEGNAL